MIHRLEQSTRIPRPLAEVFPFFADAANLQRITPPQLRFKILTPQPIAMRAGTIIDYSIGLHGIPMRWKTLIEEFQPNSHFVDLQLSGPYKLWRHRHQFQEAEDTTTMRDTVDYELPFGPLGSIAHALFVRPQLDGIFNHRTQVIREIFGS